MARIGRFHQQYLGTDGVAGQTLLPSLDHAVKRERGGFATIPRGIELRAVQQPAGVMRYHGLRILDLGAFALDQIL